ncbi:mitochondrial enolase superfamily member 1 isoform X1 [Lingula anatina]|uniref:Mitochondrial enolase superfamily member 1 n=1 Tax=Lingula anatina TaxID=7574 RepID=A0A1S3J3E9_LINAN|nr:mitochondrial enolase superfamily member 1 isoform X1 [Lingula anatina]|eukprot:XP_013404925.1 mitochondrial enolase superfamily member 1 isoform X1 [Lingula anatina]
MATITELTVKDVRFPTSLEAHGSDAMHADPDYSCAYVIFKTDSKLEGHGLTFSLGRGNDLVCNSIKYMGRMVVGKKVSDIFDNFGIFWEKLVNDTQFRWLGPEKGVVHLATAGIVNALWDMWAKMEGKPLWKLLVDMEPEKLVSTMDFRYLSDALTPEEALAILKKNQSTKAEREKELLSKGYPAYTTSAGWLGYSEERIKKLCQEAMAEGFTKFKVKVGADLKDDIRRCRVIREQIGYDKVLMTDANQRWDVQQSIDWMKQLAEFKPLWIEEPTSPDDIMGHAAIAKALKPYGIGVATGEMCQNRVMFKQFIVEGAMQFCQIDSCRLGGVNEILVVLLMAYKYRVPVCPHGGGVGLCEYINHLCIFDYICVSASMENRVTEYVDHLHEHFKSPCVVKDGCYTVPKDPGYSAEMKEESLLEYEYPSGSVWKKLFAEGKFTPE